MSAQRPVRASRSVTARRTVYRPTTLVPQTIRRRRRPGAPGANVAAGVPILQGTVGARLLVEASFGADILAASSTWDWTDITEDVQVADGARIEITIGRSNEAAVSQPASCQLRLDNRSGDYSFGPQSVRWPNIRRGTPIRVSVDTAGNGVSFDTRFVGGADSWQPRWDPSGASAWVELSASGTIRRLIQGGQPVKSALRRALLDSDRVVAYWPCEVGESAMEIPSALEGHPAMAIFGTPEFGTGTEFECSEPLPDINGGAFRGVVPAYTATNEADVRWLMAAPDTPSAGGIIFSVFTSGTLCRVDVVYATGSGGTLQVIAYDSDGNEVEDSGAVAFNVDGSTRRYSLTLEQDGADIDWILRALEVGFTTGGLTSGTITAETITRVTGVAVCPNRGIEGLVFGHIVVQDEVTSQFTDSAQLNANFFEAPTTRFARLCDENSVEWTIPGTFDTGDGIVMRTGYQTVAPLVDLLREVEAADGGIMFDGTDPGLTYRMLRTLENQDPVMTLDATAGDVTDLEPLDDDQNNVNKVTATRAGGADVTFEDTDGELGRAAIGVYDDAVTVNLQRDAQVLDAASWRVHLGTVPGYRYPTLRMHLGRSPALAPLWATITPGDRVDVTGLSTVRTQHPAGDLPLIVHGYTEAIDQFEWTVEAHVGPFGPYRIARLAADDGDAQGYPLRLGGDGSTIAASVSAGASSVTVATPSGPLWTTDVADFPLEIAVFGQQIEVTAISGTSSPQTFTLTPATVTQNLVIGQPVELWQPNVLGM